jgi:hypothetical protein
MSDHDIISIRYDNDSAPIIVIESYGDWYVISNDGLKRFESFKAANLYAEALGYDED